LGTANLPREEKPVLWPLCPTLILIFIFGESGLTMPQHAHAASLAAASLAAAAAAAAAATEEVKKSPKRPIQRIASKY